MQILKEAPAQSTWSATEPAVTSPQARSAPSWWKYRVFAYLLAGLLLVDIVVRAHAGQWQSYDPDDYRERVVACQKSDPSLVLLGGSPVSEGIDPASLNGVKWQGEPVAKAFNLGLPGATACETYLAAKHGLASPPRLLIYGITASDLNDSRAEPHGPRSLMTADDVIEWTRLRSDKREWAARHYAQQRFADLWGVYAFRNGIRLWAADEVEAVRPGFCPDATQEARAGREYAAKMRTNDGFAPRPEFQARNLEELKAAGLHWSTFHFLEKYRLGGYVAYLERLIDLAAGQGSDILLLDMPVTADLEERLYPEVFRAYRANLAEVAARKKISILSASRDKVGLTDANFADLIHLNRSGVARLSEWLRRELETLRLAATR